MNMHLQPSGRGEFVNSVSLLDQALAPEILIGMPHLTPLGLSENWLLRELGHRHWLLLARAAGMTNADFHDREGREAYAAISALSMKGIDLTTVKANDVLRIDSSVRPISRTQVLSRHELSIRTGAIGSIELISTFIARLRSGDNHSIARVVIAGLPDIDQLEHPGALAKLAAAMRAGEVTEHFGLLVGRDKLLAGKGLVPDENRDFNGAGLLYFANFPLIADSIINSEFKLQPTQLGHLDRDVFYSGNVNPGETVDIHLTNAVVAEGKFASLVRILRQDRTVIAQIFTRGELPFRG